MDATGMPVSLPLQPILVLSPHLGEGVFSCGRLLASVSEATVATLLAGRPPPGKSLTERDRAGFGPGQDDVALRREEDARALAVVGACPDWQDLPDVSSPDAEDVAGCIESLLMLYGRAAVFFPLGLFHPDNRLVSDAALAVQAARHPRRWWVAYEEAAYRRVPGLVAERLAVLVGRGLSPRPVRFPEKAGAAALKHAAVACYASPLQALASPGRPGADELAAPEGYWWVAGSPDWARRARVRLRRPGAPAYRLRRHHELVV